MLPSGSVADEGHFRVRERLLVSVTGSPMSPRLVRATARLAASLQAEWVAVHVETPSSVQQPAEDKDRLTRTFKLAEQLGGETITLSGQKVVPEILQLARCGKSPKSFLENPPGRAGGNGFLARSSTRWPGKAAILTFTSSAAKGRIFRPAAIAEKKESLPWQDIGWAAGIIALCTLVNWPLVASLRPREPRDDLPSGDSLDRLPSRPVSGHGGVVHRRPGFRFLFCAACAHLRRDRHAVRLYVHRHADCRPFHQHVGRTTDVSKRKPFSAACAGRGFSINSAACFRKRRIPKSLCRKPGSI